MADRYQIGMLAAAAFLAIGFIDAPQSRAQSQPAGEAVVFEVASVKPVASEDLAFGMRVMPGGRLVAQAPLEILIAVAYNLPINAGRSMRLAGLPSWTHSRDAVYHIEATSVIPSGLSNKARGDRIRSMMQALLADRFKLKIHRETREVPVYALAVAKGGPKFQKSDIEERECPDHDLSTPLPDPDTLCHSATGSPESGIHARALTMQDLADFVEHFADRQVVDRTGIKGLYHIETAPFVPMDAGPTLGPGTEAEDGTAIVDRPTVFKVFEKLGLKMESRKDKVQVYVVDHLERPIEN